MEGEKKASMIYILEILRRYSDKDHLLNYSKISTILAQEYDVMLERKTIARDIDILASSGYDIIKRGNYGVCLGTRDFEEGELIYLIDAIYSSRSIPVKYAREMVEKLTKDYSIYNKKKFKFLEKIDDGSRSDNKQVFYTIEILDEAIAKGKKVEFQYCAYGIDKKLKLKKEGKTYKINPYYMVNNHGKYYLVCNYDKYDNIGNYKIESISNIKILDEPIKPIKSLPGQEHFSIKQYMNEHIYMMAGASVRATIKVDTEKTINDLIGWFGDKIDITNKDGEIIAKLTVNEDSLIYWALQYGEHIEIKSPETTRTKIKEMLENIIKKYKG